MEGIMIDGSRIWAMFVGSVADVPPEFLKEA